METRDRKMKSVAVYLCNAKYDGFGLGEFENHLAIGLARCARELEREHGMRLLFIVEPSMQGAYGSDVGYIPMDRRAEKRLRSIFTSKKEAKRMPAIDLLHLTNQGVMMPPGIALNTLMTVHDVNFFHNHISRFTEGDVKSRFKVNVPSRVIYNGVTDLSGSAGCLPAGRLPGSYFLHISRLAEKKNVHLLVKMMKYLPGENLVLAGRGHSKYEKRLREIIRKEKLTNVYMVGHVTAEEKAALLGGCRALLFPSRSEGFGLPVVEAMCFGKPVFLSNLTSLPEVGGEEAFYFKTLEPSAMAATVSEGMEAFGLDAQDKSARIKERAATFNWDKTASGFISYYLDILKEE